MPERGSVTARLQALYDAYLDTVAELERTRRFAGMFGLRGGPADHPCHERFVEDLRALLAALAEEELSSAALRDALRFVYEAPETISQSSSAYWVLLAVHGFTEDLIARLSREDAGALANAYAKTYPRYKCLPSQVQTLKRLKQAAGRNKP